MSAVNLFVTWSGWVFTLLGFAGTVISLRLANREKTRGNRLASTLSRAQITNPTRGYDVSIDDARITDMIIRAAADRQLYDVVSDRAARQGVTHDTVDRLTVMLKSRGILTYAEPLTGRTTLSLNL